MFFGLIALNYISNYGVSEMVKTMEENTSDLSDYGIFVNADGDLVEEGEQQLQESYDHYGY